MKSFKKTFNFYVTDSEIDNYVHSILRGPQVDPEDEIDIEIDRDNYNCYVTLNVFDRVLHQYLNSSQSTNLSKSSGFVSLERLFFELN